MTNFDFNTVEKSTKTTTDKGPRFISMLDYSKTDGVITYTKAQNVRIVTITKLEAKKTTNGAPLIEITVTDEKGDYAKDAYWTDNTTVNAKGKTKLQTYAPEIIKLLTATGLTFDQARAQLGSVTTNEDIVKKLNIIIGKTVKIGFYGKLEVNKKDGKEYINAKFMFSGVMPVKTPDNEVRINDGFDETQKYINKYSGKISTSTDSKATESFESLPW